jgi:hypothetical protein
LNMTSADYLIGNQDRRQKMNRNQTEKGAVYMHRRTISKQPDPVNRAAREDYIANYMEQVQSIRHMKYPKRQKRLVKLNESQNVYPTIVKSDIDSSHEHSCSNVNIGGVIDAKSETSRGSVMRTLPIPEHYKDQFSSISSNLNVLNDKMESRIKMLDFLASGGRIFTHKEQLRRNQMLQRFKDIGNKVIKLNRLIKTLNKNYDSRKSAALVKWKRLPPKPKPKPVEK